MDIEDNSGTTNELGLEEVKTSDIRARDTRNYLTLAEKYRIYLDSLEGKSKRKIAFELGNSVMDISDSQIDYDSMGDDCESDEDETDEELNE